MALESQTHQTELIMTKAIQKYDIRYTIGSVFANVAMRLYHRRIWISGTENISPNTPIIFAPNHQNALLDAMAIIYAMPGQTVFLARADIFRISILSWFFRGIKMLPVYRIRDGKENLSNNDSVFDEAVGVLKDKKHLALFPEAVHNPHRSLLPLKKGIPRIAFLAEEQHNFELGLEVVPIGIYYSDTDRFDEILQIQVGKPIALADFKDQYSKNPQKSMISLRNAIADGIRPLIIDIKDKTHYRMYECLRYLYNKKMRQRLDLTFAEQPEKFIADKAIIKMVFENTKDNDELLESLNKRAIRIVNILQENNMEPRNFHPSVKKGIIALRLVASIPLLPFLLYGGLNHIVPITLGMFGSKKIPDPQFISSVKFIVGLVITPIFYIIQALILLSLVHHWFIVLGYILTLPIAFMLFKYTRRFYKTTLILRRSARLQRKHPELSKEVEILSQGIKTDLDNMPL